MEIEIAVILTLALMILVNEFSLFMVNGWFADREALMRVEGLAEEEITLNRYNKRILQLGKAKKVYVSYYGVIPGILSFYHVQFDIKNDYSRRIPIWSKTHRRVKGFYRHAKKRQVLESAH